MLKLLKVPRKGVFTVAERMIRDRFDFKYLSTFGIPDHHLSIK